MSSKLTNGRGEIVDTIIERIKEGQLKSQSPFRYRAGLPLRSTGEAYRGINVLILSLHAMTCGYSLPHWFTYKQAEQLGAHVKKGERSQSVVFYKPFKVVNEETGEEEERAVMKSYRVFNASQIEGLPDEFTRHLVERDNSASDAARLAVSQLLSLDAKVNIIDEMRAYYKIPTDEIHIAGPSDHISEERFATTLAHEFVHWTSHKSRLDRDMTFKTYQDRAKEELIAEIGAAFLSWHYGLSPDHMDDHCAYLASWLTILNGDPAYIMRAAAAAQRAVDYILERVPAKGGQTNE